MMLFLFWLDDPLASNVFVKTEKGGERRISLTAKTPESYLFTFWCKRTGVNHAVLKLSVCS